MPKIDVRDPNFSGHETFCFRYGWLKKGVDAVAEDPYVFTRDDALVTLGVGKNMVRSIRHWCLAARLIQEEVDEKRQKRATVTEFGEFLFSDEGADPFLEDPGTLWVLHWLIASNKSLATTWYYAFSHWTLPEFSKEALTKSIIQSLRENGLPAQADSSIRRDVDCFVRTYVPSKCSKDAPLEDSFDCPLTELELIVESNDSRTYYFNRGDHPSLDPLLLAFMISDFWKPDISSSSLTHEQIAYLPGSPGRLVRLDDSSLSSRLYALEKATNGAFIYQENSGLMQLSRQKDYVSPKEFLQSYYQTKGATSAS